MPLSSFPTIITVLSSNSTALESTALSFKVLE
jgi:hypothetical protein